MKILKVGGSVVTDKTRFESLKERNILSICNVISKSYRDLILVHGAGSFGHPHVKKYGISSEIGAAKVHVACLKLNNIICQNLVDFGVPAFPIHPFEVFKKDGGEVSCDLDAIVSTLKFGLPVLHGDVIRSGSKFEVISGDDIVVFLAERLDAEKIGFACETDILIDRKKVEIFKPSMLEKVGHAEGKIDVTGGMRSKIEKILSMKLECDAYIFKGTPENVAKFLRGEVVGTRIVKGD
ncbi:hypothetical protein DRP04_01250 [Archaeoglobales archaeon]|nr:MAG: hypothetical protein DRP04_01250 [Archaeoglobales archaeon]